MKFEVVENPNSGKEQDDQGSKYLTIAKFQVGQTEDESKDEISVKALRLKGKQDQEERPPSWWNSSVREQRS